MDIVVRIKLLSIIDVEVVGGSSPSTALPYISSLFYLFTFDLPNITWNCFVVHSISLVSSLS